MDPLEILCWATGSGFTGISCLMIYFVNGINKRFDKIDDKFEKIDQKFEKIDDKFEKINEKFDNIDRRLIVVETILSNRDFCALRNHDHLKNVD